VLATSAAHAQSNYRITTGDTLSVEVLEDPSLNRTLLVLPDGSVNFPFAGTLRVSGRTVSQVQGQIISGISSNFASAPTVFVTVSGIREQTAEQASEDGVEIFFVGEVGNPGPQFVAPGTTFLQAISLSGGFTTFAATKRVQLRRTNTSGQPTVFLINYRDLSRGSLLSQNIVLSDGDVILVPERRLFE
tara:strand:- start:73 stop:639 length:567 start_codon:yes stop_codon:yes gene_type:complete